MRKLRTALVCVIAAGAFAFALTGCASTQQDSSEPASPESITVTDAYGRDVTVPADADTCATVGSAARFVVYAGAQDKLIAITEMDTPASPARAYTEVYADEFAALPTTSNGNHLMETSVDAEKMLELKPDVIISSRSAEECDQVYADEFAALPTTSNGNHLMETSVDAEKMLELKPDVIISSRSAEECDQLQQQIGIPVVGISYQDQMFTDNVYNSILAVGQALGTSEHAQSVVDALKSWQADLSGRTAADIPDEDKPTCYAGAVNFKGAKSFGGTYAGYPPFEAVNVKNVADETGQSGSVEVTLEQIGEWNPDFMFLNAGNMDLLKKDYADNTAFFNSLTAFQTGNLYTQPAYNMNGTNIETAICDAYFVGATVYPEQFSDVDLSKKYDEIFSTMLGADYYEQMKSLGVDFKTISFS